MDTFLYFYINNRVLLRRSIQSKICQDHRALLNKANGYGWWLFLDQERKLAKLILRYFVKWKRVFLLKIHKCVCLKTNFLSEKFDTKYKINCAFILRFSRFNSTFHITTISTEIVGYINMSLCFLLDSYMYCSGM